LGTESTVFSASANRVAASGPSIISGCGLIPYIARWIIARVTFVFLAEDSGRPDIIVSDAIPDLAHRTYIGVSRRWFVKSTAELESDPQEAVVYILMLALIVKHLLANEYGPLDRILEIGIFLFVFAELLLTVVWALEREETGAAMAKALRSDICIPDQRA